MISMLSLVTLIFRLNPTYLMNEICRFRLFNNLELDPHPKNAIKNGKPLKDLSYSLFTKSVPPSSAPLINYF